MILDTESQAAVDFFRKSITPVRETKMSLEEYHKMFLGTFQHPQAISMQSGRSFGKSMMQSIQEQAQLRPSTMLMNQRQYQDIIEISRVDIAADRSHKK